MKRVSVQGGIKNSFWLLLLFLAGFFLINNINEIRQWVQIDKFLGTEEDKRAFLEEKKHRLEEKKEYVQTSDFVEKEAREKLGLGQSGQVRIILPPLELIPTPVLVRSLPCWQRWYQLFFP